MLTGITPFWRNPRENVSRVRARDPCPAGMASLTCPKHVCETMRWPWPCTSSRHTLRPSRCTTEGGGERRPEGEQMHPRTPFSSGGKRAAANQQRWDRDLRGDIATSRRYRWGGPNPRTSDRDLRGGIAIWKRYRWTKRRASIATSVPSHRIFFPRDLDEIGSWIDTSCVGQRWDGRVDAIVQPRRDGDVETHAVDAPARRPGAWILEPRKARSPAWKAVRRNAAAAWTEPKMGELGTAVVRARQRTSVSSTRGENGRNARVTSEKRRH